MKRQVCAQGNMKKPRNSYFPDRYISISVFLKKKRNETKNLFHHILVLCWQYGYLEMKSKTPSLIRKDILDCNISLIYASFNIGLLKPLYCSVVAYISVLAVMICQVK